MYDYITLSKVWNKYKNNVTTNLTLLRNQSYSTPAQEFNGIL